MAKERILVVDDEQDIVDAIEYQLKREGFRVSTAGDGERALALAQKDVPDAIVLDLMLPGVDGLDVCRTLRAQEKTKHIPILMLTAKTQEADRVVGLELGADDYITKPFSVRELVARIKAVLRRMKGEQPKDVIELGALRVDQGKHVVTVKGQAVALTAKEYGVLTALLEVKGRVLSREQLLERVWGYDRSVEIETRTVDLHVSQLRRKLGPEGKRLLTVKSAGYRLETEP